MISLSKKITLQMVVLAALLSSSSVFAQSDMKIVLLDMNVALFNSDLARSVDEEVTRETAVDQAKIRDLAEEAQRLQEDLQQNLEVLDDASIRRKTNDIQALAVQYEFLLNRVESYVEEKRQEFQQAYSPNLLQAITELVEEESIDIVMRAEVVLHYTPAYDITAQVTEKLNQQ